MLSDGDLSWWLLGDAVLLLVVGGIGGWAAVQVRHWLRTVQASGRAAQARRLTAHEAELATLRTLVTAAIIERDHKIAEVADLVHTAAAERKQQLDAMQALVTRVMTEQADTEGRVRALEHAMRGLYGQMSEQTEILRRMGPIVETLNSRAIAQQVNAELQPAVVAALALVLQQGRSIQVHQTQAAPGGIGIGHDARSSPLLTGDANKIEQGGDS
jgi:hypothetical protein